MFFFVLLSVYNRSHHSNTIFHVFVVDGSCPNFLVNTIWHRSVGLIAFKFFFGMVFSMLLLLVFVSTSFAEVLSEECILWMRHEYEWRIFGVGNSYANGKCNMIQGSIILSHTQCLNHAKGQGHNHTNKSKQKDTQTNPKTISRFLWTSATGDRVAVGQGCTLLDPTGNTWARMVRN